MLQAAMPSPNALGAPAAQPDLPHGLIINEHLQRRTRRRVPAPAEHAAIARIVETLAEDPSSLSSRLVEAAAELCGVESAGLTLLEHAESADVLHLTASAGRFAGLRGARIARADAPCHLALQTGEPQLVQEPGRCFAALRGVQPPVAYALTVPIRFNGRSLGTLWVASHIPSRCFDHEDERVLEMLAGYAAAAAATAVIDRTELSRPGVQPDAPEAGILLAEELPANHREDLRRIAMQLAEAEQRERGRVAQLVHDHFQQWLVAARLKIELARKVKREPARSEHLKEAETYINRTLDASRSLCHQLSPSILQDQGLPAALAWLAGRMRVEHGLSVHVDVQPPDLEVPPAAADVLFQAARELLFNTVKHAGVPQASVRLEGVRDQLHLIVSDQGKGCGDAGRCTAATGFGLPTLRQRLRAMGGSLTVRTAAGQGFTALITLPRR